MVVFRIFADVLYNCMENANYWGIPEGVGVWIRFSRYHHDKGMGTRIDGIICSSQVIGSIIDPNSANSKYRLVLKANCQAMLSCKWLIGISIKAATEETSKQVVFQGMNEVLQRLIRNMKKRDILYWLSLQDHLDPCVQMHRRWLVYFEKLICSGGL